MRRSDRAGFGAGRRRLGVALLLAGAVLLLAQACGQSGKATGPGGNSSVAVGLKKISGALPQGCTGTVTATGPVTVSGSINPNGQVTLGGLVPGTYVFSALLDCSPNGTFAGQSPPTQIVDGVNNVTIEITTAPIDVGVKCDANQLTPGQSTTCHCQGSLVTGGTPTFSWSGGPSGSSSQNPLFTFPTPGTFSISCTVSNGPLSKPSPSVTVQVKANNPTQGTGTIAVVDTGCCGDNAIVTFAGPQIVPPITGIGSTPVTRTVNLGTYTVSAICSANDTQPLGGSPQSVTLGTPGQIVTVTFSSQPCG